MCGIFGGVGEMDKAELYELGFWSQNRGKDAGGLIWYNESHDKFCYAKRPGPVTDFVIRDYPHALDSSVLIGHTRLSTSGPAHVNENNHPHIGQRFMLVHNGHVWNDDTFKCKSDCDSEAIVHALEESIDKPTDVAIEGAVERLEGATTVAMIDTVQDPNAVWLWRDAWHDLYIAKGEKAIYFASESWMLFAATGLQGVEIPNYHAVRIDKETLEYTVQELKNRHEVRTSQWEGYNGYNVHPFYAKNYVTTGNTKRLRWDETRSKYITNRADWFDDEYLRGRTGGGPRVHLFPSPIPDLIGTPFTDQGVNEPWPDSPMYEGWHIGFHMDTFGCSDEDCTMCADNFGAYWRFGWEHVTDGENGTEFYKRRSTTALSTAVQHIMNT